MAAPAPPGERRSDTVLNEALVTSLNRLIALRDETALIAAPLAVRSGLERIYSVDDHTADRTVADSKGYGAAIMDAWNNPVSAELKQINTKL